MTADLAPRRSRKPKTTPEQIAIGEMGRTIFTCPACTRPLVLGSKRCPGCGTHLIIGVQAQRAGILLAIGLFAGLLLGGVLSTTATVVGGAIQATVAAVTASSASPTAASPSSSSGSTAATPGTSIPSSVSALTRSALVQTVATDERLALSSAALSSALAAKSFDAYGVSQILRSMSADAVVGLQLASHIGAWSGGKQLSGELTAFYSAVQDTAVKGLSVTIQNAKAYRATGNRMIAHLGGLAALDVRVRDVAAQAGVTFVPLGSPAP